jgi:peptidoglycan hydrolase CwlO-like protein
MTNQNNLQEQLESFKLQMKEVNESLYNYESKFEQEKQKVKNLQNAFCILVKLINHELISSLSNFKKCFKNNK